MTTKYKIIFEVSFMDIKKEFCLFYDGFISGQSLVVCYGNLFP